MATAIPTPVLPRDSSAVPSLLQQVPAMLEYRSEADPDAEFIPKTIAGFVFGAMVFGFCINFADALYNYFYLADHHTRLITMMLNRGAFMLGITAVASSLLLVGLKARADHTDYNLFAKHWLNSIGTGSFYALLIWVPWILIEHGLAIQTNRFIAAAILMAIMSFPAIACAWTIGPAAQHHD